MSFSPFRTVTVGSGISPDLLVPAVRQQALAGFSINRNTAGGEFRPALRIIFASAAAKGPDYLQEPFGQTLPIFT